MSATGVVDVHTADTLVLWAARFGGSYTLNTRGISYFFAISLARSRLRPQMAASCACGWLLRLGKNIRSAHQLVPTDPFYDFEVVSFTPLAAKLAALTGASYGDSRAREIHPHAHRRRPLHPQKLYGRR